MKIHFAGNTPGRLSEEKELVRFWKFRLLSYFHLSEKPDMMAILEWLETNMLTKAPVNPENQPVDLFLDSGAFSAHSIGAKIELQDYIEFIHRHEKYLKVYANLDVIGDPEATRNNQLKMEKEGLNPLPCFHYGEPVSYLKWYLDRYDYLALGGMVPISNEDLAHWLDDLFANFICSKDGMPRSRIHGFGLTSLKLMIRYPWYSVDSTSWVMTGRMGGIYVPFRRGSRWEYTEKSWKIDVSTQSPSASKAGRHISTLSPSERKIILDYFTLKGYQLGKSEFRMVPSSHELADNEKWAEKKSIRSGRRIEIIHEVGLSNDYRQRDELNIQYFLDLEKALPKWPWPFFRSGSGGGLGI